MFQFVLALLATVAFADEEKKSVADTETKAEEPAKKTEKRGISGLGYGYAYDGGYEIGAGSSGPHGDLDLSQLGGYGGDYHGEHVVKTVTLVKNVPYPVKVPYPVIKEHVKHVDRPYPVKVIYFTYFKFYD